MVREKVEAFFGPTISGQSIGCILLFALLNTSALLFMFVIPSVSENTDIIPALIGLSIGLFYCFAFSLFCCFPAAYLLAEKRGYSDAFKNPFESPLERQEREREKVIAKRRKAYRAEEHVSPFKEEHLSPSIIHSESEDSFLFAKYPRLAKFIESPIGKPTECPLCETMNYYSYHVNDKDGGFEIYGCRNCHHC